MESWHGGDIQISPDMEHEGHFEASYTKIDQYQKIY